MNDEAIFSETLMKVRSTLIASLAILSATAHGFAEDTETSLTSVVASSSIFSPAACGDSCSETCTDTACLPESTCCLDSYLCDETCLGGLKNQQTFDDTFTYSMGGELRHRYMDESNRLRPEVPLPQGGRTQYQLWRFTPYASLTYRDFVTGYIQGIDASAFGYDAPFMALPIDVNRADLLRYYVEFNLGDVGNGNLKYRYGQQFLKYGSQHVLSNLGWSNTYRNFFGHKFLYQTSDWTIDGFAMESVNGAAGGSNYHDVRFDDPDRDRQMNGLYTTYSGMENNTFDYYWLWSLERNENLMRQDGDRHTIGMRWAGSKPVSNGCKDVGKWTWDMEGAYQFGKDSFGTAIDANVSAGFFNAIGGYTFSSLPGSPALNGIFYWGSGDSNPNDNEINTVYTLYPLGHAYWGLIDNFSGQNLLDYGISASVKPAKTVALASTFHWFDRANQNDAVYNIVGAPIAAGVPGKSIGNELDLVATITLTEQMNVQLGYFWFWYGDAITNGAAVRPDADQFYVQTTIGF